VSASEVNTTIGAGVEAAIEITNNYTAAYGSLAELIFSVDAGGGTNRTAAISSAYTAGGPAPLHGDLRFATRNASAMNEWMRITAAGNVGIGTSAPSYGLLDVRKKDDYAIGISSWTTSRDGWTGINIAGQSGAALGEIGRINVVAYALNGNAYTASRISTHITTASTGDDISSALAFSVSKDLEAMRINNLGNVGIGTTSPGVKLEVKGKIRVNQSAVGDGVDAAPTGITVYDTWTDVYQMTQGEKGIYFASGA